MNLNWQTFCNNLFFLVYCDDGEWLRRIWDIFNLFDPPYYLRYYWYLGLVLVELNNTSWSVNSLSKECLNKHVQFFHEMSLTLYHICDSCEGEHLTRLTPAVHVPCLTQTTVLILLSFKDIPGQDIHSLFQEKDF